VGAPSGSDCHENRRFWLSRKSGAFARGILDADDVKKMVEKTSNIRLKLWENKCMEAIQFCSLHMYIVLIIFDLYSFSVGTWSYYTAIIPFLPRKYRMTLRANRVLSQTPRLPPKLLLRFLLILIVLKCISLWTCMILQCSLCYTYDVFSIRDD
jgi:hypothetical protein